MFLGPSSVNPGFGTGSTDGTTNLGRYTGTNETYATNGQPDVQTFKLGNHQAFSINRRALKKVLISYTPK